MKRTPFLRIISLILLFSVIISSSAILTGCLKFPGITDNGGGDSGGSDNGGDKGDGNNDGNNGDGGGEETDDKIVVPPIKDYDRATVAYSSMEYSHPDFDAVISDFGGIVDMIEAAELPFEEQLEAIENIYPTYANLLTMYTLANIKSSINTADEYWAAEYEYVSTSYPRFSQAVEDMYVAAANSPYAERFEEEYFGEGLIEEYKDGGKYTDAVVKLLADEAELEAKYSALSTATVKVEYKNLNDTVDNILNYYESRYGADSSEYAKAYEACMLLYQKKYDAQASSIYVSLIKIRRLIADALGYGSYAELAYKEMEHDYSAEDMSEFIDGIVEYALPVYINLYSYVFYPFFESNTASELSTTKLINTVYKILGDVDTELQDIYGYMLTYSLYDIQAKDVNRFDGAFTTYIHNYDAPFIFMSSSGDIFDYSTLIHEFGHFSDNYINYGGNAPLDTSEIYSQALELLMIDALSAEISSKDALMIKYNSLCTVLETLIYQGFYARFEERVYALKYEDITTDNLNAIVKSVANEFTFDTTYINDISVVLIPHTMLYPFYVQSYCTSVIPAVELYFTEKNESGTGFSAYKNLLKREDESLTFEEELEASGLTSPFARGHLKNMCDMIHYEIYGSYYFKDSSGGNQDAA